MRRPHSTVCNSINKNLSALIHEKASKREGQKDQGTTLVSKKKGM
jgi:hypothetical protein